MTPEDLDIAADLLEDQGCHPFTELAAALRAAKTGCAVVAQGSVTSWQAFAVELHRDPIEIPTSDHYRHYVPGALTMRLDLRDLLGGSQ